MPISELQIRCREFWEAAKTAPPDAAQLIADLDRWGEHRKLDGNETIQHLIRWARLRRDPFYRQ